MVKIHMVSGLSFSVALSLGKMNELIDDASRGGNGMNRITFTSDNPLTVAISHIVAIEEL